MIDFTQAEMCQGATGAPWEVPKFLNRPNFFSSRQCAVFNFIEPALHSSASKSSIRFWNSWAGSVAILLIRSHCSPNIFVNAGTSLKEVFSRRSFRAILVIDLSATRRLASSTSRPACVALAVVIRLGFVLPRFKTASLRLCSSLKLVLIACSS
jgi:hypothetical protein